MAEPLTLDRFRALAEAYGGSVARWPDAYRTEAARMASEPAARAILDRASALDSALDAWTVPAVSDAMRARAIAGAPSPRMRGASRARLWWSGIGIAAALAGATAGAVTVAIAAPVEGMADGGTAFGDVAPQES